MPLYVLPKGYVVFVPFRYEKGYSLCPFCLESGLVEWRELQERINIFVISVPKE